tara:strand:+ start:5696 stop:5845 length:150 start_codon:yes stop_codon:yes gene_type:complete
MATKWTTLKAHTPVCGVRGKKTSIGRRNIGMSSMNKDTKRNFKKYRGQG